MKIKIKALMIMLMLLLSVSIVSAQIQPPQQIQPKSHANDVLGWYISPLGKLSVYTAPERTVGLYPDGVSTIIESMPYITPDKDWTDGTYQVKYITDFKYEPTIGITQQIREIQPIIPSVPDKTIPVRDEVRITVEDITTKIDAMRPEVSKDDIVGSYITTQNYQYQPDADAWTYEEFVENSAVMKADLESSKAKITTLKEPTNPITSSQAANQPAKIPGFEGIFALISLLLTSGIVLRKQNKIRR